MEVLHKEQCNVDPNAQIRIGWASWDHGKHQHKSVKFTWFDKRGYACRGGEVPVEALQQMVDVVINYANLSMPDSTIC